MKIFINVEETCLKSLYESMQTGNFERKQISWTTYNQYVEKYVLISIDFDTYQKLLDIS